MGSRNDDTPILLQPSNRRGGLPPALAYAFKGPVVFFVPEASRHVTGQALAIDGGGSVVILN